MTNDNYPVIRGSGGGGGGSTHVPTEAPDTLQSRSYARVLDLLCEGEIEGLVNGARGVYLDDTPLQNANGTYNFSGISVEERTGQQEQSHIPGFPDVENEVSVGVTIKKSVPVVRTINNNDVDSVRMKFRVPLLTEQLSNGDIVGATVAVRVQIKSAEQSSFGSPTDINISGKTTSPYERQTLFRLTGSAPWEIKVTRLTNDSELASLNNDVSWSSFTEIIDAKLSYPNSALCGISIDAEQFQSIPTRTYDVKMAIVKVPTNYNQLGHVHVGFWDGSFKMEWTDNPAWCYYDMVTNPRYGLGDMIPQALTDKWELYKIAKYCDELVPDGYGGMERRFTMNAYFDTKSQALKMLNDMTSVFRSMLYWSGESLVAVQDAPQDVAYLFTESNVVDGTFTYESSARKSRPTALVVQWNNPELGYEPDFEYVEDVQGIETLGLIQEEVVAIGCTSRGQAHRFGKWYLYTAQMETQIVTFSSGMEGIALRPGIVIGIQDRSRSGVQWGGRIKSLSDGIVKLDRKVTLDPGQVNFLNVLDDEGKPNSVRIFPSHGTDPVDELSIDTLLISEDAISDYSIFTISNQSHEMEQARILTIEEQDGTFNIAALIQHPGKFDLIEKDIVLEDRGTTRGSKPAAVTSLTLDDYLYIDSKIVKVMMAFDWQSQEDALNYDLKYRKASGNWTSVPEITESNYQVEDVLPGDYEVWVRVRNVLNLTSAWAKVTGTVLGKQAPPEDITGLTLTLTSLGVEIKWDPVKDLDLAGYEVRFGSSWDDGELVDFTKSTSTTHLPVAKRTGRDLTYHVRAKDTSTNYSETVTTAVANIPELTKVEGFRVIQHDHQLTFHWHPPITDLIDYWEIRSGEVWASGATLLQTATVGAKQEWLFVGDRIFWIKAFDIFGFESEFAVFYNLDVTPKVHVNVVAIHDYHTNAFPGSHPGLELFNGVELRMKPDILSGEYNYEVELLKEYHCTLLVDPNIRALANSGATWKSSAFPWNSEEAEFPWAPKEDLKTLTYSHRIAVENGSGIGDLLSSWPLDDDLLEWSGNGPLESHDLSFEPCRFHHGVKIEATSKLKWDEPIPAIFALTFTIKLISKGSDEGVGQFLFGMESTAHDYGLYLHYDSKRGVLTLSGDGREVINLPIYITPGQVFMVGLMQTTYVRTLVAQKLAGDVYTASSFASYGSGFDRLTLTDADPKPPELVSEAIPESITKWVNDDEVDLQDSALLSIPTKLAPYSKSGRLRWHELVAGTLVYRFTGGDDPTGLIPPWSAGALKPSQLLGPSGKVFTVGSVELTQSSPTTVNVKLILVNSTPVFGGSQQLPQDVFTSVELGSLGVLNSADVTTYQKTAANSLGSENYYGTEWHWTLPSTTLTGLGLIDRSTDHLTFA